MGGEKKRFCPVVLPIILIDLINSVHASAPKSISCWWGMGSGGSGRLQSFFLFVVKQNKTKWKTARHDKWGPLSTRGGVKRQGGRGEGYETLVWISKPFISRIEEEITSRLVFYHYIYAFRCRFGSFKPSLYNLLPFQLSYVMFSVFLCHVVL